MVVNKIGRQHIDCGINCQNYGIEKNGVKLLCSGCPDGKHSEVGAKMFCHLMEYGDSKYKTAKPLDAEFQKMVEVFGQTPATVMDFICFTILMVVETDYEFVVTYCGNGFIIEEFADGRLIIEDLNNGESPKYYAYNYIDSLTHHKESVGFQTRIFLKSEYKNIGIAADGIKFIKTDPNIYAGFVETLLSGDAERIRSFINKNQSVFSDDITIVF